MAESIKILFWKDAKFAVHPFFSLEKRLTPAGNLFRIKMIKQEGGLYVGIKCNGVSCNLILQGRMMRFCVICLTVSGVYRWLVYLTFADMKVFRTGRRIRKQTQRKGCVFLFDWKVVFLPDKKTRLCELQRKGKCGRSRGIR